VTQINSKHHTNNLQIAYVKPEPNASFSNWYYCYHATPHRQTAAQPIYKQTQKCNNTATI